MQNSTQNRYDVLNGDGVGDLSCYLYEKKNGERQGNRIVSLLEVLQNHYGGYKGKVLPEWKEMGEEYSDY